MEDMRDSVSTIIVLMFLATLAGFVWSVIRPNWGVNQRIFKTTERKKLIGRYLGALFVLFVAIGVIAPPQQDESTSLEVQPVAADQSEVMATTDSQESLEEVEPEPEAAPHNPDDYWHEVVSVTDGDTLKARIDGEVVSIRVIGIDAPESTNKKECFGNESSAKAKEFLSNKWIKIASDYSQDNLDKYDRWLRYVFFDEGTDFGKRMIEEGYAYEYTYDERYFYQDDYKAMEDYAKDKSHGLWSKNTCNGKLVKAATSTPKPTPKPTPIPTPTPAPTPPPSNCDPNYSPCVPNVSYDLNCPDIGFSVRVLGTDKHGFDRDGDGYGCESY